MTYNPLPDVWTGNSNGDTFTNGKKKPVTAPVVVNAGGGGEEKKKRSSSERSTMGSSSGQAVQPPSPQTWNPSIGSNWLRTQAPVQQQIFNNPTQRPNGGEITRSVTAPGVGGYQYARTQAPVIAPPNMLDTGRQPQAQPYGFTTQSNMLPDIQRPAQSPTIAATKNAAPTLDSLNTGIDIAIDSNSGQIVGREYDPGSRVWTAAPLSQEIIEKNKDYIIDRILKYNYNNYITQIPTGAEIPNYAEFYADYYNKAYRQWAFTGSTNTGGTAGTVPGEAKNAGTGNTGSAGTPPAAGTPLKGSGPFTLEQINAAYPTAAEGKTGGTFEDLSNKSMTWQDSYGNNLSAQYYNVSLPKKSGFYIWNGKYYAINQGAIKAYKSGGGGAGWGGYWNKNSGSKWYEQMTNWTI